MLYMDLGLIGIHICMMLYVDVGSTRITFLCDDLHRLDVGLIGIHICMMLYMGAHGLHFCIMIYIDVFGLHGFFLSK